MPRNRKKKRSGLSFTRTPGMAEAEARLGKVIKPREPDLDVCLGLEVLGARGLRGLACMEVTLERIPPERWTKEASVETGEVILYVPRAWWLKTMEVLIPEGWELKGEATKPH